jgi:hypothetical protein
VKRTQVLFLCLAASVLFGSLPTLKAQDAVGLRRSRSALARTDLSHSYRTGGNGSVSTGSETGGIKETIDNRYKQRYQNWKNEFLSTEIGRAQWDLYNRHPHLQITITVVPGDSHGAGSGNYKWNEAGELTAATIVLGTRIDEGYPSSVYYPVMNAIEPYESSQLLNRNVLAAAKIAHEFGHVIKMASTNEALYKLQVKLVPMYNKIFLSNGHNVNDPRLVDLARQMGGNPVEIWEDREYWGEANAMLFLRDRIAKENFHCKLFNKIKRSVEEYAKNYEDRFTEIAKSQGVTYACSWK